MKKLIAILLLISTALTAQEFEQKPDGFSVGFFGGYQGSKVDQWLNGGQWGIGLDYIRSLPESTWVSLGTEIKMVTIQTATLSDFGIKAAYGVMMFDMWRFGLGARFDVNMTSVEEANLGRFHLTPYITNSVVFPMNSYSGVELFLDLGMPVNFTDVKNIKVQGFETRVGLNWLFKV